MSSAKLDVFDAFTSEERIENYVIDQQVLVHCASSIFDKKNIVDGELKAGFGLISHDLNF